MPRATPAPVQTPEQEGFVSPTREPEPMTDKDLAQAAAEIFEEDLEDRDAVQAEIDDQLRALEINALEQMLSGHKGLHAKLAEVMLAVGRIPKNGKAPAAMGGYPFVQVGDAADAIRKELGARGVSMLPEAIELVNGGSEYDNSPFVEHELSNNRTMTFLTIKVTWRLTDAESGETATIQSLGTGADNGDKFSPKAQTNAMKYAMLMGFLLSTGEDPEVYDLSQPAQGPGIEIGPGSISGVRQGGRQTKATAPQLDKIREVAGTHNLTPMALATFIGASLGGKAPDISEEDSTDDQQRKVLTFLSDLSFDECGKVVKDLLDIKE